MKKLVENRKLKKWIVDEEEVVEVYWMVLGNIFI